MQTFLKIEHASSILTPFKMEVNTMAKKCLVTDANIYLSKDATS